MSFKFECKKCGDCCYKFKVRVGYEDITRWKEENRFDIIESVDEWNYIKRTGKDKCPWLENNLCSIHSTKPMVCRHFPHSKLKAISNCSGYQKQT